MKNTLLARSTQLLIIGLAAALLLGLSAGNCLAYTEGSPEFRALWVDAFHSGAKSASQIDSLLSTARSSNINAVVVQMRRRGDVYYPSDYDPWAPNADQSFDAIAYLIDKAHTGYPRIEVHIWFCMDIIWDQKTTAPSSPNHVYNKHPEWLSQTDTGVKWGDSSNGGDNAYWIDPGHPDCEQYTHDVVMDVVNRYDVDGINFDRIRYPGNEWGYNPTTLSRYKTINGVSQTPIKTNSTWLQFRRDQVTALVRKIYVDAIAAKPNIKVSAATITWGNGPSDSTWTSTSAYSDVLQDWRSWMSEGILDINMPMTYYREYQYPSWYDNWIAYQKTHKYNRHLVIGPAIYLNAIQDSITQFRETRNPASNGQSADGIIMYTYGVTNDQNKDDDLNYVKPDPTPDPDVPNSIFYNALAYTSSYDTNPTPIFNTWVSTPTMPWKAAPTKGHIRGTVLKDGNWVDHALVALKNSSGATIKSMYTDGTGYYAFVDVLPGNYNITVSGNVGSARTSAAAVTAGQVTTTDFNFTDTTAPSVPQNLQASAVSTSQINLSWSPSTDNTGVTGYKIYRGGVLAASTASTSYSDTGRTANVQYSYTVSAYDAAGNESAQSASVSRYSLSVAPNTLSVASARGTRVWYNSNPFPFNNNGIGAGRVDHYDIVWDSSSTHTWTGSEATWAAASISESADSSSSNWYFHVRGCNGDNIANGTLDLGPYYFDSTAPVVSSVTVPQWYLLKSPLADLSASWQGSDTQSGINLYSYAIGTSAAGTDILNWTSIGTNTSASYTYASAPGFDNHYYWSVKAKDAAGNWSPVVSSHWQSYADSYGTLAEAMNHADNTAVIINSPKKVSANFGGFIYVQESNRSRGLRLEYGNSSWLLGNLVGFGGHLGSLSGERVLTDVEQMSIDSSINTIKPLVMKISSIGGSAPDAYTLGLSGAPGIYTAGLLVRVAGKVVTKGSGYFMIDDGSGAAAKVYSSFVPADMAIVGVTGIACIEGGTDRVIRATADPKAY